MQKYLDIAYPTNVGQALDNAVADFFAGQGTARNPSSAPSTRRLLSSNEPSHERPGRGGHRRGRGRHLPGPGPPAPRLTLPLRLGRKHAELTMLLGPGSWPCSCGFVLLPICIAAYYGLYNWSGYGPLSRLHRPAQLQARAVRPGVPRVAAAQPDHRGAVAAWSSCPISIALALLLNRRIRGGTFLRLVVFAPYVLSEATTAVMWLLMLQPGGFVDQVHAVGRARRAGPAVAGRPDDRAVHPVRRAHLEVHRLRHHPAAGRPAGHPGRAARGGRDRRRVRLADDPAHHAAAARPDDPDLGLPVDHRLAAAVRHRVDHDARRPGERVEHDGRRT